MCKCLRREIEVGAGEDGAAVRAAGNAEAAVPLWAGHSHNLNTLNQANVKLQTPSLHDVVEARLSSSLLIHCGPQPVVFGNTQTYLSMPELVFREAHKHTAIIVGGSSTR